MNRSGVRIPFLALLSRPVTTVRHESDAVTSNDDSGTIWKHGGFEAFREGDGFLDLIVVNAENGVTSERDSYVYRGGPGGLTGERAAQVPVESVPR